MDSTELIGGNLPERITKRDRDRKNIIEKRREEKEKLAVDSEQLKYFQDTFYATCNNIQELLDSTATLTTTALPNLFTNINKEILTLWSYLSQSKMFLKVYDIRKAQETLQHLELEANDLEIKLLPKKKFGFKNRRAAVCKKPPTTATTTTTTTVSDKDLDVADGFTNLNLTDVDINNGIDGNHHEKSVSINKYTDSALTLSDKIDENLILDAENVNKNDVLLSDLTRCTVKIYGAPITVHMVNLKQCQILIGPVSSSVFADNCNQCTFAFACQQFRLHSSNDCSIYIHVISRPIIEDSHNITVAPYNWNYDDQINHFNLAGIDITTNNWDSVDDFNWLSYEKHSPHWSILKPELRVKNWD